ncbi:MAG: hypothetical protein WKF35_09920 [Ferruginibacter sp.]
MKHTLTTIFVIFICGRLCIAQTAEKTKLSALSFELGKSGLIYNLNFDHKLASKNFGFRVGAGSNLGKYLNVVSLGGGGYYLVGNKNKFLELGLDIQYLIVDEVSDDQKDFASIFVYPNYSIMTIYPSLNLGYRWYGKNALFRVGLSPGIIKSELIPGGYISYGIKF